MRCSECSFVIEANVIFRTQACDQCGADLHCCQNCHFFDQSKANECRESSAERVLDKKKANFCDFFKGAQGSLVFAALSQQDLRAKAEALFQKKRE